MDELARSEADDSAAALSILTESAQECLWILKRYGESCWTLVHEGSTERALASNQGLWGELQNSVLELEDALRRPEFSRVEAAECWALARLARRVCLQHWSGGQNAEIPIEEAVDGTVWRDLRQFDEEFDERRTFLLLEFVRLDRISAASSTGAPETPEQPDWVVEYDPVPRVVYRGHELQVRHLEARYIAAFVVTRELGAPPLQRSKQFIEDYLAEGTASIADPARREDDQRQNVNEAFKKASMRSDGPRWIGFQVTPIDRETGRRILRVGEVEHIPTGA